MVVETGNGQFPITRALGDGLITNNVLDINFTTVSHPTIQSVMALPVCGCHGSICLVGRTLYCDSGYAGTCGRLAPVLALLLQLN